MNLIKFIDIQEENLQHQEEISLAINKVIAEGDFINGKAVTEFENSLSKYLNVKHVIGVSNGTDALQLALLALGLKPGDEVIAPAFTYFATIEAIAFLGLVTVLADIDENTFTLDPISVEKCITDKTKVIIPVHIYGNPVNMNSILQIAKKHNLKVIEDAAQSIGASTLIDNSMMKISTIGDIGCFSFYPAKNLGAYGDAGAVVTNNEMLAIQIRKIANHGQTKKYVHEVIGMNSRLDSIQAAVLSVKLKYLDDQNTKRVKTAKRYSDSLIQLEQVHIPAASTNSTHVFHQYTIKVPKEKRNLLKEYLDQNGIPTRLYYPIPVHKQKALKGRCKIPIVLKNTDEAQDSMLSLPMHSNLDTDQVGFITKTIGSFFS